MGKRFGRWVAGLAVGMVLLGVGAGYAQPGRAAVLFAAPAFGARWSPTDEPVAAGAVPRGWVWGAGPTSAGLMEPYADASGGQRLVQYFDKARMELGPNGTVTTGLLTRELVTGRIQTGDSPTAVEIRSTGSNLPLAGDATNTFPTYAQLRDRIDHPQPDATGQFVTDTFIAPASSGADRLTTQPNGMTTAASDPNAAFVHFVPETGQNIPRAFWAFLTASGPAMVNGALVARTPLFDWLSVTGYPIAPAVWATVTVGGVPKAVMIQPFERRVLTYTPANNDAFKVEMGNIGQHYFQWRYLGADASLTPVTPPASTAKTGKPTAAPRVTPTPATTGVGPIRIVSIVAKAPDLANETVTLRNDGFATVDLTRWTLADSSGKNIFTFPPYTLTPGGIATVHSGHGMAGGNDFYWNKNVGVWHDAGDTATLRDATGTVIATYTYP